jgi:predicted phage tail protein
MVSVSRLIAGIFFVIAGAGLTAFSFNESFFLLIYGIPMIIVGVVLLLNKNEDKIEARLDEKTQSKSLNKKKSIK